MSAKTKKKPRFVPVHTHAAGIDIGSRFHVVAVGPDRDPVPVRTFNTFTNDLNRLADWLEQLGITTVAMESTSVYWIPVYEILEARGLEVLLVNARDARNVPGRKTDVSDAQWLQQLHYFGLLRGSFRPTQEIVELRAYLRQRERLVAFTSSHIQHMQKALDQMNVQLHHVVSNINGKTGMLIIRDILAGTRDPIALASHRDPNCKSSVEMIAGALVGNYRAEHVFALRQAVELYDFYQERIAQCDREIEQVLGKLRQSNSEHLPPLPKVRNRHTQMNALGFDVREALYAVAGVDLTQIHGLGPLLTLKLISECGTDMTRWPTSKHFTSWLSLAPGRKISGGKVLDSRTRPSSNRSASLLRLAAVTIGRTDTALGAFYRRLAGRIGKAKAITATARKIAVLFYNTLRYGMDYKDPGASYYEERYRQRVISNLHRRAESFGFTLIEGMPREEKVCVS